MSTSPDFVPATVSEQNGAPALTIRGQPVFPLLMMTTPDAVVELQQLGFQGSHLHTLDLPLGWTGINRHDFTGFDAGMKAMIAVDPDALIIPRITTTTPKEWMDAHPDELVDYADPASWQDTSGWGGPRHPSWASAAWRRDVAEALCQLIRHARHAGWAAHLIGWHLGSGVYGEWHYPNPVYYPDTSKVFVEAYARWLAKRYPGNTPPPRLPAIAERRAGRLFNRFHDPVQDRWMTDHAEFLHEQGAETLACLAAVAKRETDRRSVVVAFFGYVPDLGINHESDHGGLAQVLRNPDIDILASPHTYRRRKPGDDACLRGFIGSVHGQGKLWLDEQDDRTHIALGNAPWQKKFTHVSTSAASVEILWRGFAQALTHGAGLWMMDQGAIWEKATDKQWYRDPAIAQALEQMHTIGTQSLACKRQRVSQVAVICSYRGRHFMTDPVTDDHPAVQFYTRALAELWKSGIPFDLYQFTEAFEPGMPSYEVYIFLDTCHLTDRELAAVNCLKAKGKTLLFYHAPALLTSTGFSLQRMQSLLDMELRPASTGNPNGPAFDVCNPDPIDPEGLLYRRGRIFFSPYPTLSSTLLRIVYESAGVHVYADSSDIVMAGGGYVALHAASAGLKTLRIPKPSNWINQRSGECTATPTDQMTLSLAGGETALFAIDPP